MFNNIQNQLKITVPSKVQQGVLQRKTGLEQFKTDEISFSSAERTVTTKQNQINKEAAAYLKEPPISKQALTVKLMSVF